MTSVDSIDVIEGTSEDMYVKMSFATSAVDVSVARLSGDADLSVASGPVVSFTGSDWDTWKPATFAAAQDLDAAEGSAQFRFDAPGAVSADITVTEIDDEYGLPCISNTIPYQETFESYDIGRDLAGRNGWYSDDAVASVVDYSSYTNGFDESELPLTGLHSNVLHLVGRSLENRFEGTEGEIEYLDMMICPVHWSGSIAPELDDAKLSLAVNTGGFVVVCHGLPGTTNDIWTTLPDHHYETQSWFRLTVELDNRETDTIHGCNYFRIWLDGNLVTNSAAYSENDGTLQSGGSWFACCDSVTKRISTIEFEYGMNAMIDDLCVSRTDPFLTYLLNITAEAGGAVDPSSLVHAPPGSTVDIAITPDSWYSLVSVTTNGVPAPVSPGSAPVDFPYVFEQPSQAMRRIIQIGQMTLNRLQRTTTMAMDYPPMSSILPEPILMILNRGLRLSWRAERGLSARLAGSATGRIQLFRHSLLNVPPIWLMMSGYLRGRLPGLTEPMSGLNLIRCP
jgi:hypothetical protein